MCSLVAIQDSTRYIFNQYNNFHVIQKATNKKKFTVTVITPITALQSEPHLNLGVLKGGDPVIGDITTFTGYENRNVSYLIQELPKELYRLTCDCDPQLHSATQILVWCLKSVIEYAFLGLQKAVKADSKLLCSSHNIFFTLNAVWEEV